MTITPSSSAPAAPASSGNAAPAANPPSNLPATAVANGGAAAGHGTSAAPAQPAASTGSALPLFAQLLGLMDGAAAQGTPAEGETTDAPADPNAALPGAVPLDTVAQNTMPAMAMPLMAMMLPAQPVPAADTGARTVVRSGDNAGEAIGAASPAPLPAAAPMTALLAASAPQVATAPVPVRSVAKASSAQADMDTDAAEGKLALPGLTGADTARTSKAGLERSLPSVIPASQVQGAAPFAASMQTAANAPVADNVKLAGPAQQWQQPLQDALGDRLQVQLRNGAEHAVIRLDPPNLGRIDISVRHSGGSLQVNLSASNGEVLRQLQAIGDNVRQDLGTRQYSEVSVSVTASPRSPAAQAFADGDGRGRQGARQQDDNAPGRALSDGAQAGDRFALHQKE